ncbi:MAG: hypothetical protein Q9N67_07055 [Ghiorsea sp.]|nr:hypothetical protein [Ghiorsea sp.]
MSLGTGSKKFVKYSILYMLFEGLSKGGSLLILLYVAYALPPATYLIFMLLISLETFLPILYASNYSEVLYTIKDRYRQSNIYSTILTITFLSCLLLLIMILIAKSYLYQYFEYESLFTYLAIPINIFFFVFFKFLSLYQQLHGNHAKAIYFKSMPFFLSFLGALGGVLWLEDPIAGFFIGKTTGYFFAFIYLMFKEDVFLVHFKVDTSFLKEYLTRSKFLFIIAFFGWLGSYGFLNIGKLISTEEKTIEYGYLINLLGIFLMLANGINQVYSPKVRQLYNENKNDAYVFSKRILIIYSLLAALAYLVYQIILYINQDLGILDAKALNIFVVMPYAILIFWISSFKYVSDVYIYVSDTYKSFTMSLFVVEVISFALAVYLLNEYSVSLLHACLIIIFARSSFTFMYVKLLRN